MPTKERLKPTDVAAALKANRGLVYLTADKLGVSAVTVYAYAKKYPIVKAAITNEKEKRLDTTEGKLFDAIDKGEAWAICFYLKTQGKARGYIERVNDDGENSKKPDAAADLVARLAARLLSQQPLANGTSSDHPGGEPEPSLDS